MKHIISNILSFFKEKIRNEGEYQMNENIKDETQDYSELFSLLSNDEVTVYADVPFTENTRFYYRTEVTAHGWVIVHLLGYSNEALKPSELKKLLIQQNKGE